MLSFARRCFVSLGLFCGVLQITSHAEPVPVRQLQGAFRAYAVIKNTDGKRIATGEIVQSVRGLNVTSRVTFKFRDGSVDDETTVFSQKGTIRLISDHHVQQGPTFPVPTDVFIHGLTGEVDYHTPEGEMVNEHQDLPPDISNGLPPLLVMNIPQTAGETKVSYLAPTSKPRLVHLSIRPGTTVNFGVGGVRRQAVDYVVHVEIGGLVGAIAPMIGKQPSDYHIWVVPGAVSTVIREEGQFFEGGPVWRVEQVAPSF